MRARESESKNKMRYDQGIHHTVLEPGDRVLVCNLREVGGPGKLRSHWEDKIHFVMKKLDVDSPVCQVLPKGVKDITPCTLHRILLLPCDDLPMEAPVLPRRKRASQGNNRAKRSNQADNQQPSDQDGEDIIVYFRTATVLPTLRYDTASLDAVSTGLLFWATPWYSVRWDLTSNQDNSNQTEIAFRCCTPLTQFIE